MDTPIIKINDVFFSYNDHPVLEDVNLNIGEGDFVIVIGPNGGGKTTLLKLILGLLEPDRGDVRVMGQSPRKAAPHIGYVPQDVHINRNFPITAIDVVLMGLLSPEKPWRRHTGADRQAAMAALEHLGIGDLAQRKIAALSGGQRQRVFIARALVTRPELMLLDEPTASIDARGQAELFNILKNLNREVTIMVVSHDLMVISRYAKSVACVNRTLFYHDQAEITEEMLNAMYPCMEGEKVCPVELVAHGLPHRVLQEHKVKAQRKSE